MRVLPLVTHGNVCPHCGGHTYRVRMPMLLRMVRHISPAVQRRACINPVCSWHGFAHPVHHQAEPSRPVPQLSSAKG